MDAVGKGNASDESAHRAPSCSVASDDSGVVFSKAVELVCGYA
jgi:hypothetical protein